MKYISAVLAIIVVGFFSYGAWKMARLWNYSWSYEDQVKATVCEMVKQEHLKSKCD